MIAPRFSLLLLLLSVSLDLLVADANAADAAQKRPNVLWIITEDMGPELACYGTTQVSTPNVDRLAATGVRFASAYTTAPVCSASRSAFNTGMYQTTIGAHNHRSHRNDSFRLPPGVDVISRRLASAGYFTANVRELPESLGFPGTGKTDWNFNIDGKPFQSDRWDELKAHQPFYAQVNFQESHRKFHAPHKADPAKVVIPPYYPDDPITRQDWAGYLDAISEADRKIGLLLDQLAADGLADDTIVFFFGDHGQCHVRGKQFCYEEGLHIPLVMRWPKNFPAPAGAEPGTVDRRLVEAIDLTATTLDLAGLAKPASMAGRVLFGTHREPERKYIFGARDRCDETVFRLRTVRDDRYRYIRNFTPDQPFLLANKYKERSYPVWNLIKLLHVEGKLNPVQDVLAQPTMPPEELYDLQADPYETRNLANSSEHRAELERLRGVLEKWLVESDDQGRFPEAASSVSK
jgi:arylsulfatase A-like enzyme